jgi:apolipoprotein N-acyltransferase
MLAIASSFYWGVAALRQTFDATPVLAWTVFIGLVALEGLSFGLFIWTASVAARRGVRWMWIVPCAWTAIEYAYPRVFPWKLAYSQLEFLPLIQIAELVGAGGIGFVVTAVCAVPTVIFLARRRDTSRRDRRWAIAFNVATGLLLVATLIFGYVRLEQWSAWCAAQPKFKVALIQVDPIYVGAEKELRERTLAVHESVDLVCWPESALGTYSDMLAHFRDPAKTESLSRQSLDYLEPANGLDCHLLAGGKLYREGAGSDGPYAQTAFLVGPDQDIVGRYRKRTLLPFGEYIPGQRWYPRAREWATLSEFAEAGNDPRPLVSADGRRLGVVICYEDMLPRNVRQTVAAGAEVIVSLIQGTAFENPLTLVQHERLAALRAVENRRYFLRCSSTGVTCLIAPTGAMVARLPPQKDGTLVGEVSPIRIRTPYTTLGDWLPLLCGLFAFWGLFAGSRRRF